MRHGGVRPTRRLAKSANKTGFSSLQKTHNLHASKEPLPHLNIRRAPVRQLAHEVVADGRQPHREVRPAVLVLAVYKGDIVVSTMLPHDVKIRQTAMHRNEEACLLASILQAASG